MICSSALEDMVRDIHDISLSPLEHLHIHGLASLSIYTYIKSNDLARSLGPKRVPKSFINSLLKSKNSFLLRVHFLYPLSSRLPKTTSHRGIHPTTMSPLPFYIIFTKTSRSASESSVSNTDASATGNSIAAGEMKDRVQASNGDVKREICGDGSGGNEGTR